jgi:hypothetical protein
MENNYDGKTAFVFAAFDAEAHAANEGGGFLFELKDVAWVIRIGAQRLPKNYSIGYVLLTTAGGSELPTPVAQRVPDLPDEVATQMRDEANSVLFIHHYGMSAAQVFDTYFRT